MRSNRIKNFFTFFAFAILITGIVLTIYNRKTNKAVTQSTTIADTSISKTAKPLFEIGYLLIDLDIFKGIANKDSNGVSGDFMYPVLPTDITTRALTNTPLIAPDYTTLPHSVYLKNFISLYKTKKTKLSQTWVACLLVQQKGKGNAMNTVLDYDEANLITTEMYDGTDITHLMFRWYDSTHTDSTGFVRDYTTDKFALNTMNMNSNVLVPICILNFFSPPDPDKMMGNEDAWKQVTNGTVLVPQTLRYSTPQGDTVHISMEEFLNKPILVSK